uniref:Tudor domain-containing protein 1 n=1 Tax=Branchiostoma floridae TaxID=7739 RepID=C3Y6R3_BRAFL|eukprot:XP_002608013.1 hypothetical protein BRAFLDRAFT_74965 [Branchiostoma floridae]
MSGDGERPQSDKITLYVSGIPLEMDADGLKHFFSQTAIPLSVDIKKPQDYSYGTTYGFVEMASVRDADALMREFDQRKCGKFTLKIRPARPKAPREESYTQRREPHQKVSLYATQGQSQSGKESRPQPAIRTIENRYGKSSPSAPDRDPQGRRHSGGGDSPPPLDDNRPPSPIKRTSSTSSIPARLDMSGQASFTNKYSQFRGSMAGQDRSSHSQPAVPDDSDRGRSPNRYPGQQGVGGGVRRSVSQSNMRDRQPSGEFNRGGYNDRGYGRDSQVSPSQRAVEFERGGQRTGVRTSPSLSEMRGGDRTEARPTPQGSYTNGMREDIRDATQMGASSKPSTPQPTGSPQKTTERPCVLCGQLGKSKCSTCKTPYCSRDCQRKHWPEHKNHCRPVGKSDDVPTGFENFDVSAGEDVKEKMDTLMALSGIQMVSVTEVVSPENISVQIIHHETILELSQLMVNMAQTYEGTNNEGTNTYHPQAGELCAAKFSDGGWYRASVDSVNPDGTLAVTYVDFGNSESIPVARVRKLDPKMAKLPLLAVKCSLLVLAGKGGSTWNTEVVNFLKTNIVNKECSVTMKELQGGTALVEMVETGTGKSVADMVLESGLFVPCQKPPPPPQDPQEDFGFLITHIDSPASFYGQVGLGADMKEVAVDLARKMELIAGLPEAISQNKQEPYMPQVGELCCALWEMDGMWYRAEVVEIVSNSQLKVFFLDYGNTETVTEANTRPIPESFTQCPALALHCKLAGVSPVNSDMWLQQATKSFKDLTKDKLLMGTPMAREGDVLSVELKDFATGSANKGRMKTVTRVQPPVSGRFDVLLKCVKSPGLLYCQLTEPSGVQQLQVLLNDITHHCQAQPMDPAYIPDIGEICCVNSPNGRTWLRAQVQEHRLSNKVQIECVDIGKQVQVSQTRLRPALPQHTDLPLQVFKASLAGVVPVHGGEWSKNSADFLTKYVDSQRLTAEVVAQEGDLYFLHLWDRTSGQEVSLSQMLSEEGLAHLEPLTPEGSPPPSRKRKPPPIHPSPTQNGHIRSPSPVQVIQNGGIERGISHKAPPAAAVGTAGMENILQEMKEIMAQQAQEISELRRMVQQLLHAQTR